MAYNVSFDISGILILLALWLILQKLYAIDSRSNRLFKCFVLIGLSSAILDLVTAFTIEQAARVPVWLNMLLNTAYMATANSATCAGVQYMFSTVKLRTKFHTVFNYSVIISYGALLLVNLFTGVIFDFKGQTYNKGVLFYSTYLVSLVLVAHMAVLLVFRRKLFSKKQLLLFSSFIISPLFAVSLQIIFPEYLLTVFATAFATLLMLFALETPDFVELEYLRKNLEREVEERTRDLKSANEELERKNYQSKRDMELAAHVQQVLYPHNVDYLGWDIALRFDPLSGISGDLYDFYVLEGKLRGFGLFDVSGHGISSGLVTVLAKNTIFNEFRTTLPLNLSEAMARINNSVIRVKGGIENYLTGIICRIDKDDPSKIELANAGAPYPVFKAKNKRKAVLLTPNKDRPQYGMLGIDGLRVCFQTIRRKMNIGDVLVLYTDGLTEAENAGGVQYGRERVLNAVGAAQGTAQEILDALSADFKRFVGETEIDDDITVLVVKRIEETSADDIIEELEAVE